MKLLAPQSCSERITSWTRSAQTSGTDCAGTKRGLSPSWRSWTPATVSFKFASMPCRRRMSRLPTTISYESKPSRSSWRRTRNTSRWFDWHAMIQRSINWWWWWSSRFITLYWEFYCRWMNEWIYLPIRPSITYLYYCRLHSRVSCRINRLKGSRRLIATKTKLKSWSRYLRRRNKLSGRIRSWKVTWVSWVNTVMFVSNNY